MAALPYKYFTATDEQRNLFVEAATPGGVQGLEGGTEYSIMNTSTITRVFYEEREAAGAAGTGKWMEPGKRLIYEANEDSPLFVWTRNGEQATIAVAELE